MHPAAQSHRLVMLSSGAGRWVIAALLAAYAFCDGLAQYLAAATPLPAALAMPHSVTRFLQVLRPTADTHCTCRYTLWVPGFAISETTHSVLSSGMYTAIYICKACFMRGFPLHRRWWGWAWSGRSRRCSCSWRGRRWCWARCTCTASASSSAASWYKRRLTKSLSMCFLQTGSCPATEVTIPTTGHLCS
jgi:hypothetical protein